MAPPVPRPPGRTPDAAGPAIAQAATRAEPGCIAYDFFTCTDDPDRLVFVETWVDQAAHDFHMEQQHTKDFIAFHEQFHESLVFETINIASNQ